MKKPSLLSQVLGINVLLVTAAVLVASVAAGLDLNIEKQRWQFLNLALAIGLTLLVNAWLLRRRFRPLERLLRRRWSESTRAAPGGPRATSAPAATSPRGHAPPPRLQGHARATRGGAARAATPCFRPRSASAARVARDLHDEVNQALTRLLLRLEAARQEAPPEHQRRADRDQDAREPGDGRAARTGAGRFARPRSDDHGLVAALGGPSTRSLAARASTRSSDVRGHLAAAAPTASS